MNIIEIKDEIRRLKKEEQLRLNQLENIDKRNSLNVHRSQNKTLEAIDNFLSDLDILSSYYQRTDAIKIDNDGIFISEKIMDDYELIESNIDNVLEGHFQNLKLNQESQEDLKIIEDPLILEQDFQKSLYLKHEAEMMNIQLRMELASVEAQISWLSDANRTDKDLADDSVDVEINKRLQCLSKDIKEICRLESYLEIYPEVENRLQILVDKVQSINEIVKQYQHQLNRYKLKYGALEDEIDFHENVKDNFGFLTEMVDNFQKLSWKLETMKEIVDSLEEPKFSKDDQLLIRLKSQFDIDDGDYKKISDVLINEDSVKNALLKEIDLERNNVENIQKTIDLSLNSLRTIHEEVDVINGFILERNGAIVKSRVSLINKENHELFLLGHICANKVKNRLKEIKRNLDSIKLDIAFDE